MGVCETHKLLAPAALGLFGLVGSAVAQKPLPQEREVSSASRPPNIVLVLADDLGFGELGCYGSDKILTPNLDRLCEAGMRFTRHYAGDAVCAPSRCVLLTGLHTGHAHVRDNSPWARKANPHGEGQAPLPPDTVTLPRLLKEAGYATGTFGKWGLGGPGDEGEPHRQGVDEFFGYLCQAQAHNHYPDHLWKNGERVETGNRAFPSREKITLPADEDSNPIDWSRFAGEHYAPELFIQHAEAFIRAHADEPFFLYYPSALPHLALQVPETLLESYPSDWDPTPYLGQRGYLPHPRPRAAYAAMITHLDLEVGRLLAALEEEGILEETLFLFTSDNGPSYAGGVDHKFFESSAGLRGLKGSLYEGGLRVPLIASWPGVIAAGTESARVSAFQDLLPTLCAIAGARVPEELDGIDLSATLRGRPARMGARPPLYWELGRRQALLHGNHKLVRQANKEGKVTAELYDLKNDPYEKANLAASEPALLQRMIDRAQAERVNSQLFAGPFDHPSPGDTKTP